jgi:hypothetical protein
MRYSVNVPNFGEFAAPEVFADVARRAEEAGWDALLVWDHVVEEKGLRRQIADPSSRHSPRTTPDRERAGQGRPSQAPRPRNIPAWIRDVMVYGRTSGWRQKP